MSPLHLHLRDPGGSQEYPWRLRFRRAVRHLPIGMMDVRVLEQRKLWVDSASRVHRISDLSDEHLENIIATLRHRAVSVFLDFSMAAGLGRFTPRSDPPVPVGDVRIVARRWVATTPLWRALHVEAAARTGRRADMVHRLDATAGMWAVRTEAATFVLDLDTSRLLKVWMGGDPRSRQPRWEPLERWVPIRVGGPLRLRPARGPAWKWRRKGDRVALVVVSIHPLPTEPGATAASVAMIARLATRLYSRFRRDDLLTRYRTQEFLNAVGDIRASWAALDLLRKRHGITHVDLVPSRLRDPTAPNGAVDLLTDETTPALRDTFQADVDAAVGYHLPVTTLGDYAPRSAAEVGEHSMELQPGT